MLLNLVRLFSTFFKIGLFSIGGGYAILPMIKEQVVQNIGSPVRNLPISLRSHR